MMLEMLIKNGETSKIPLQVGEIWLSGHGKKWEQIGKKKPQNKSRSCEKAPGPNFLVTQNPGCFVDGVDGSSPDSNSLLVAVLFLAEPIEIPKIPISNHAPKANQPTNQP